MCRMLGVGIRVVSVNLISARAIFILHFGTGCKIHVEPLHYRPKKDTKQRSSTCSVQVIAAACHSKKWNFR